MEELLDEYQQLVMRMNYPRVAVDNGVCPTTTIVKVISSQNQRLLLDVVEVLTELNLSIRKAYISYDGCWFMDVFHATDRYGRKLADEFISIIEHSLSQTTTLKPSNTVNRDLTVFELTGTHRPGLFSEIAAVLADLGCSVVDAKLWTHNGRMASIIFLKDSETGSQVEDQQKLQLMESRLRQVLKREHDARGATVRDSELSEISQADRRLHSLMLEDRDYEGARPPLGASLSVHSCEVPNNRSSQVYSVVCLQCSDRLKLFFDVVCTLTELGYVMFHGTVDTEFDQAYLEFYLRHSDGTPICSEVEQKHVFQCLQAGIQRRASKGSRLEFTASDRKGLLAEVTRTFRENGLSVTRAEVSTKCRTATDVFNVADSTGRPADPKTIDAVLQSIDTGVLKVGEEPQPWMYYQRPEAVESGGGLGLFFLGNFVKRNLFNLGLIRTCS